MIKFKLHRDQVRMIEQGWLPYMTMLADSQMRNNAGKDASYLNCRIAISLLQDLDITFKRKLIGSSLKIAFNISVAHASIFYMFLMLYPIYNQQVYEYNFRQQLCDLLHKQLFANRPPIHESVPLTINDFIEMIYE